MKIITSLFLFFVGMIGYTYAGYPALLALLARGKRPSPPPDFAAELPTVTLLIAAYNEEIVISDKLKNSLALDYPADKLQILVTADGSDDQTPQAVAKFAAQQVELCYRPERMGKMAAINRAMPLARGEIVLFSDANNMYDEQVIRELIRPFFNPQVGATTGAKSILKGDGALGDSEGMYWKYESFLKKQETTIGCSTGVAGEIFAIRRELFEPAPDGIINDDYYMAMRLIKQGYNVIYVPTARSYERISLSAQDEVTRRTRIIAGRYQAISLGGDLLPFDRPLVTWQIVSHKFLRPLVPFAMIGALLTNLAALFFAPHKKGWTVAASMQANFYGLAVVGNLVTVKGVLGKLLYLPTFLVNSNWAALSGLLRFLRGGQSTLWKRAQRRQV